MAYARFGRDSDIYLFKSVEGWTCCLCSLRTPAVDDDVLKTLEEVEAHLNAHAGAGDLVPQGAFDRVGRERKAGTS